MRILDLLTAEFGTLWIGVADAIAKATLLFLAAGLASFLLRRRSAALRHMIWTLTLASVLVLPVLSIALPHWEWNLVTVDQVSSSAASFQLPASSSVPEIQPTARSQKPGASSRPHGTSQLSVTPSRAFEAPSAPAREPLSWSAILLG